MNILFVGAHFDDVELGCGGTVAKLTSEGHKTFIYVATKSDYNNYDGTKLRSAREALKEGKVASKILGATLIEDNYQTKQLTCDFQLIERLNEIIDKNRIECVFTHWDADVHQDHRNISYVTLSAARHVPRLLMYRSNWYSSFADFNATFYVDITKTIKTKIKAVKSFRSEYLRRGEEWIKFFVDENRNNGKIIGVKYAEVFKVIKYLL